MGVSPCSAATLMKSVMEDELFLDFREALAVCYPADGAAILETASCNGHAASCVLAESTDSTAGASQCYSGPFPSWAWKAGLCGSFTSTGVFVSGRVPSVFNGLG
ncbi:hypothetical protein EsDP_00001320 [Epichloe bromicola]|uniref:Uncharacterized protein n=1 Tax=Epichloe bromicola TaxID=79588 RepID=A0ABQ0CHI0_9HYPO